MRCTIHCRDAFGRRARAGIAALGLGLVLACSPGTDGVRRTGLSAEVLDAVEAGMESLSGEHWPTWTMRIEEGALAFEIEVSAGHGELAQLRDCAAIGALMRERAGGRAWSAEIVREGRLLRRCSHATAARPAPRAPLG
jgi:hypothetical protein